MYVTSLSTSLDVNEIGGDDIKMRRDESAAVAADNTGDDTSQSETAVLALCVLSNHNRFSFFEGVLQRLYVR